MWIRKTGEVESGKRKMSQVWQEDERNGSNHDGGLRYYLSETFIYEECAMAMIITVAFVLEQSTNKKI